MLVAVHKESSTVSCTNQEGTTMFPFSITLFASWIDQLPSNTREQDQEGAEQDKENDETHWEKWQEGIAKEIGQDTADTYSDEYLHKVCDFAIATNTSIEPPEANHDLIEKEGQACIDDIVHRSWIDQSIKQDIRNNDWGNHAGSIKNPPKDLFLLFI